MKLGIRLSTVAEMVGTCESIADIGSDHALLPVWLLEQGKIQKAVAGELGDGPFLRAQKAAHDSGKSRFLQVRQGDGLQVLQAGEVHTVVIAGMGGDLMVEILQHNLKHAQSFQRYILQPMKHEAVLRKWISSQGWRIAGETLIQENNKYYAALEIFPWQKGKKLNDLEILLGPYLLVSEDVKVLEWLQYMYKKYEKIAGNVQNSQTASIQEKNIWRHRADELKQYIHHHPMYAGKD